MSSDTAMARIQWMLEATDSLTPLFPPTEIYNEGWLLRLVLDWFARHSIQNHPFNIPQGGRWFSEARLPTAFAPRYRGDALGESRTHADGVVGHFTIGTTGRTDLALSPNATHFVVLEAKLFSNLASGTQRVRYFDQAARNVSCIAEALHLADVQPSMLAQLGFYVLAPKSQIARGFFAGEMSGESIHRKVVQRVQEYDGTRDEWYEQWFQPTLERIQLEVMGWESVIERIQETDPASAIELNSFYQNCLHFNQREK